jgi:hypothetical protein
VRAVEIEAAESKAGEQSRQRAEGKVMRTIRFKLAVLVTAAVGVGACSSASAEALSPWWHVSTGSRPSNIQPGAAADAVQQITVSATAGVYEVYGSEIGEGHRARLVVGQAASEVQQALEDEVYGAGNVEVTSEPGPNNPDEVYKLKFGGKYTHRFAPTLLVYGREGLVGGRAHVSVRQLVEGRSDGTLVVSVENVGDALTKATSSPVEIDDALPAGLSATGAIAITPDIGQSGAVPCSLEGAGAHVSCTFKGESSELGGEQRNLGGVSPYHSIEVRIPVEVKGSAATCEPHVSTCEKNEVSVSGGGAPPVTVSSALTVNPAPARFGVQDYELIPESPGGALDTQAGSHPFQTTFDTQLNQDAEEGEYGEGQPAVRPVALAKDLRFKLPPGLVGNPTPIPQCTIGQFLTKVGAANRCPADTAIGVATVTYSLPQGSSLPPYVMETQPVFNLEPQVGEPARLGFFVILGDFGVYIDPSVRTGGDYGLTTTTSNITQTAALVSASVTLWGVPRDPRHNAQRGWACLYESEGWSSDEVPIITAGTTCAKPETGAAPSFLTLPASCPVNPATGVPAAMQSSVEADSWEKPGVFESFSSEPLPALDGCNHLQFVPEIKVTPDGSEASKPSGLTVDVHVPQEGQLDGEGLAQSNIKEIQVTLPPGVALNPSAGDGLQACSGVVGEQPGTAGNEIGFEGFREFPSAPGVSGPTFSPYVPGGTGALAAGEEELLQPGVNFCPNASKVGEVTIRTPLLPNAVKGFVYLASPQNFAVFPAENPFETHVALYVVAEDPVSGSLVKLPGKVELGGEPGVEGLAPGQIRATFADNPQLPFEEAELHFFGGERAPLASPSRCGKYTTNALFTPWSGGEQVSSQSSFEITSGPNGSPCPGAALPFTPSLASGTTNINAGSYSSLDTTISREDGQQSIQSVALHFPEGVSGLLAGVKLCGEAEANAGTCPPESQIGETVVSVGVGGDPFTVAGGKVFITGPYEGAPFGLSITNPAKAGPFDLQEGRPVVVRAKIEVNPVTAALTVTTDPSGSPHAIPTIIEGFPLQIQHVNVLVNRPGFTFNPTNCDKAEITGLIDSAEGASFPESVPFQVTNCAALSFKPEFKVSTSAKTSRTEGASLHVSLTLPAGVSGAKANVGKVKVSLPKQLPSPLKTLQKACTEKVFAENPGNCPKASKVGEAKVETPVLEGPLSGPAYFVSHGGAKYPELIIVLVGEDGVTVQVHGETFISKQGITSATFNTVPDVPFSTFELNLPEREYPALTANGNLCKAEAAGKLLMPTEMVGQNGLVIKQSTKISVSGCPKSAHKKAPKKKAKHGKRKAHGKQR